MKQILPPTRSAGRRRSFSVRIALTVAFVGSMLVGCAPASGPSTVSGGYAANGTVIVAEDGMVHGRGSSGAKVTLIQDRLVQLGYFISDTRGSYGYGTAHAVTAFQKVQGITRDGSAGPTTKWFLNHPGIPRGSSSSGRVIEVQLAKQVVLFVENGNVRWILDASSGASATRRLEAATRSSARSTAIATLHSAPSTDRSTSTAASRCMVRPRCRPTPPATVACA